MMRRAGVRPRARGDHPACAAAHLEGPTSCIPLASRPPRAAMLAFLVPPLERNRYPLHQEGPDVLVFAHPFRGARIMVRFRDLGDRRTLVLVHGVAPLGIRRAFARLQD